MGNNDDDNTGLKHRRDSKEPHPLGLGNCSVEYMGGHSRVYTQDELDIKLTHVPPVTFTDKMATDILRDTLTAVSASQTAQAQQALKSAQHPQARPTVFSVLRPKARPSS